MKAMVLEKYGEPLVLKDVPVPKPGPDEVLLRMRACGVCGTDLKISTGRIATTHVPLIMGHEPMGEVAEAGSAVEEFSVGDRVTVSIYQTCGACKYCLSGRHTLCADVRRTGFEIDGGFAEFLCVPAANAVKVPDGVPDDEAAVSSCGIATAYHALLTRANVRPGQTVLIMGAGGLGLHAVQIARLAGARVIAVDIVAEHLDVAAEHGASFCLSFDGEAFLDKVREVAPDGVAVVFETVGRPATIEGSLQVLEPGGKLVMCGYYPGQPFSVDSPLVVLNELEILGSRLANKREVVELMGLIADERVKPIVTGTYALEEVNDVLALLREGRVTGRVTVRP